MFNLGACCRRKLRGEDGLREGNPLKKCVLKDLPLRHKIFVFDVR